MRRLPLRIALLAATTGLCAVGAQAAGEKGSEPVPHAVHYIIFQHQGYWDSALRTSGPSDAKNTRGSTEKVDKDPFDALWQALSKSGSYRPLRQGLVVHKPRPESEAQSFGVEGRWKASVRGPFLPLPRLLPPAVGPAADAEGARTDRVFGQFRFYKGRYAHLEVRLAFAEPIRWLAGRGMEVEYHILDQSRRMLSGRTYYFDHPRFGVIARVDPLE